MPFQVMHTQQGLVPSRSQASGHPSTDQQSTRQSGAARERHHINLSGLNTRLVQNGLRQGNDPANVVSAGQLGHHPAIGLVHFNLRVKGLGQQNRPSWGCTWGPLSGFDQGHTGFIARRFNAQNNHGRSVALACETIPAWASAHTSKKLAGAKMAHAR